MRHSTRPAARRRSWCRPAAGSRTSTRSEFLMHVANKAASHLHIFGVLCGGQQMQKLMLKPMSCNAETPM